MTKPLDYASTPTALDAPEIILNPGPEYGDEQRPFQGIPGIERAPGGRLWATWYAGGPWECWENYVLLVTSHDDGQTWSGPQLIVQPGGTVRAFDPCLWTDPRGRLWLFWAQSLACKDPEHFFMDGRHGVWFIRTDNPDDARPTWTEPRFIGEGIMMNKPTVLESGDWLLPVSIWKELKHMKGQQPPIYHDMGERQGAYVVLSRDEGETFEFLGKSDKQENASFDEHMIVERRDGSLWMLTRTNDGMWDTSSTDGGLTWATGSLSKIPHESSRFFIRRLQSGNLLLVRNSVPEGGKPCRSHMRAFLSEDDGYTWKGGLLLDERSKVSYPDGTQSPDGTIYIIYDYNRTRDREILMATFTEADVLAAEWLSDKARQKVLVNRAKGVGSNK